MATNEWTVRKRANLLEPGEKFVFDRDLGGEGEVVTVKAVGNYFGTTAITTEDFDIEVVSGQMVTLR
jgi:hypothetical protein